MTGAPAASSSVRCPTRSATTSRPRCSSSAPPRCAALLAVAAPSSCCEVQAHDQRGGRRPRRRERRGAGGGHARQGGGRPAPPRRRQARGRRPAQRRAGTIATKVDAKDGHEELTATKPFGTPRELGAIIDEVRDRDPLHDFKLTRSRSFLRTRTAFSGVVDLTGGAEAFGDDRLKAQTGADLGVDVKELERQAGVALNRFFTIQVAVRLPGRCRPTRRPRRATARCGARRWASGPRCRRPARSSTRGGSSSSRSRSWPGWRWWSS